MGRIWTIRLALSFALSIFTLIISIIQKGALLIYYINASFMSGLFFLVLSGVSCVIISGFFDVFAIGWKKLFLRNDPYTDKTHWSYENGNNDENEDETKFLKRKAKFELFIFLPLFIGFFLISQSFLLLVIK